jgi:SpoVK/Ycf46/Vps4 family AAA+-type ATPase
MKDKGEQIGKFIQSAAKESGLFGSGESVCVSIFPGKMGEDADVVICIPDEKKNNYGQQLCSFKQRVLNVFEKENIRFNKDRVHIAMQKNQEMAEKIAGANKSGQDNNRGDEVKKTENDEFDYEQKSKQFIPVEPLYSFNRVILPTDVIQKIEEAVATLQWEDKVFKQWGLYEIQPRPSTSLSFYGPSGTGKTMAAEAVAEKLGKKILKVSYADVESKYHGEGPKMVKAIFLAAENSDAVLFFDEADSLLSKRLTNVSQGSEQAINSMRSQLLICLEEFRGIVIFATNLVVNYDGAFLTRLISVEFPIPDAETRKRIWDVHIMPPNDGKKHQLNIPLASNVNTKELADKYDFVGREIRNAVVSACVNAAMRGDEVVTQAHFVEACETISKEKVALANAKDHTAQTSELKNVLKEAIKNKINQEKEQQEDVSIPVE